ncbi:hypothetical protein GF366_01515, partial [Candidatus Peregrinibacteria bacterium]|nr:hypothetical protein [Candidatus Peregrinibacteria bacterium]
MFKKIITILVFTVGLCLVVTGCGREESKEEISVQKETKSVSEDKKVYRSISSESSVNLSKPQLKNSVNIAKMDRKSLLSGYNGDEYEPEKISGPDIDEIVISVIPPESASDICVPGYCDEDEEYLNKIDFSREPEYVNCFNDSDCSGLCGSDVEYCRNKLANKCEEESLCAPGEFKRAFGVKWCPKEGYVESVQVDDGMLKEGYIEALCVTDRSVEGYIERVGAYGRSAEGYIENVGAYGRGPEGIIESTGSYSRGPEGYIETTIADSRGTEGYIESVDAKNRGPEGYIESVGAKNRGTEGYIENLNPSEHGAEGYL